LAGGFVKVHFRGGQVTQVDVEEILVQQRRQELLLFRQV
jgi:hypothetical protein